MEWKCLKKKLNSQLILKKNLLQKKNKKIANTRKTITITKLLSLQIEVSAFSRELYGGAKSKGWSDI